MGTSNQKQNSGNTPKNQSVLGTQQQQKRVDEKEFPTTSPLENLVKNLKSTSKEFQKESSETKCDTQVENEAEIKKNASITKSDSSIQRYKVLSETDYLEHKNTIIHIKHSPDGNYVASIDIKGTIKIWNINQTIETYNTIVQKSIILSVEWDKRHNGVLLIGNDMSTVKEYNVNEMKITQELIINKSYPCVNQICSFHANEKLIVIISAQNLNSKSGQLIVCFKNNSNILIEKVLDLENYYSQCVVSYLTNYVLFGILLSIILLKLTQLD